MKERSLIILKPDAVQRSLIGDIISRFERKGLKVTGLKMAVATEEQVFAHYNKDDAWFLKKGEGVVNDRKEAGLPIEKEAIEYGRDIIGGIAKYITAGPVVMMVAEGHKATAVVTKLVGVTEPAEAVLANSSSTIGASVLSASRPNNRLQIKVFMLILA